MDLNLSGNVKWVGGWGFNFHGGKAQASTTASAKLAHADQGHGRVLDRSVGRTGQRRAGRHAHRELLGRLDGAQLQSRPDDVQLRLLQPQQRNRTRTAIRSCRRRTRPRCLQATLQHVVATFDPVEGRKIYVNGTLVASLDPVAGRHARRLGQHVRVRARQRGLGQPQLDGRAPARRGLQPRADAPQIKQNFEAGVGEKFFLMFSVEHSRACRRATWCSRRSQFDSYSYLFRKPFFISLDGARNRRDLDMRGIRIGLNGAEAPRRPVVSRTSTREISSVLLRAAAGQRLAELGAVIAAREGSGLRRVLLDVRRDRRKQLQSSAARDAARADAARPAHAASTIGVRTFDEISATMATITGVSQHRRGRARRRSTTIRQSLPATEKIEAVLASHQVAIAQLAIEYCNALIENRDAARSDVPGLHFSAAPQTAFPASENAAVRSAARSRARRRRSSRASLEERGADGAQPDDERRRRGQSPRPDEHRCRHVADTHASDLEGRVLGGHRQRRDAGSVRIEIRQRYLPMLIRVKRKLRTRRRAAAPREPLAADDAARADRSRVPRGRRDAARTGGFLSLFSNPRAAYAALASDLTALTRRLRHQQRRRQDSVHLLRPRGRREHRGLERAGRQGRRSARRAEHRGLSQARACPATWCRASPRRRRRGQQRRSHQHAAGPRVPRATARSCAACRRA